TSLYTLTNTTHAITRTRTHTLALAHARTHTTAHVNQLWCRWEELLCCFVLFKVSFGLALMLLTFLSVCRMVRVCVCLMINVCVCVCVCLIVKVCVCWMNNVCVCV